MALFDLVVIGGGPGGAQAALHAKSLGMSVALIEKGPIGGVCLNWGCIPTKALLSAAKLYKRMKTSEAIGLEFRSPAFNWLAMLARKNEMVRTLREGMEGHLKRAGVEILRGTAKFLGPKKIEVQMNGERPPVEGSGILIATGSRPKPFPKAPFDRQLILSSDDVLEMREVPKRIVMIGGGVVGVEFASLFHALGSNVTIIEMLPRLISTEDSDVSKRLEMSFRRRGMSVLTSARVAHLTKSGNEAAVKLESGESFAADRVLISIGRDRNTADLGLEAAGVVCEGDAVKVNEYLETSASGVYAAGDVTNLPQLAHVASFSGILAVDNIKNPNSKKAFPKDAVPNCIFSDPQAASVGLTRSEAEERGISVGEKRALLSSEGKAHVEGELEGFVKLVVESRTGIVRGAHILGGEASEMIGVLALAVSKRLTVSDLAGAIFPHPTYHEIIGSAARLFSNARSHKQAG